MADGQVQIKVTMDSSGVQQGAQKVNSSLSGIESLASSGLGFGILAGIGQSAFQLITKSVTEAFNAIVKVGSEFEAQMSKVEAISGASTYEMAKLTEKAKEMGASTVFSAKEAGQAMEYMAMAGWKSKDMIKGIGGIMDLAAASGEDLAKTSDILTDAITAFGDEAKDAGRYADVMASASSNANTNVSLMGETFKYVGATAGSLGYKIEDIALATGLMANAGIKGSMAGTALRSTISRMASPTKQVKDAMEKLGISLTDSEGNMLSFRDVMLQMRTGFANLSEVEQASTAKMLGGAYAMSGLLAVVNATEEDFNKLADAIDNSNGSAGKMADTMTDNLQGSLTKFGSAAEGLGIALYDTFSGFLQGIVDFGTGAVSFLTGLITKEKTDLDYFSEEVDAHAKETSKKLEEVYTTISNGEAEASKLTAYKNVLLEVAEAGQANAFQSFQIKKIIEELGDEIPGLEDAWDEETKTLKINTRELGKNMDALIGRSKIKTNEDAKAKAQETYYNALIDEEEALAGLSEAIDEVNKKYGTHYKTAEDVKNGTIRFRDVADDVTQKVLFYSNKLDVARETQAKASEEFEELSDEGESLAKSIEKVAKAQGEVAETGEASAEALQAQADASERIIKAQARLTDAYKQAKEIITDAFDSAKKSAESAFAINPFEEWDLNAQQSAIDMKANLEQQVKAMQEYKQNMEAIMSKIGNVEGGAEFIEYLQGLGPAGARAVSELANGAVNLEEVVSSYSNALNIQDDLTNMLALDALALQEGLGLLSSTAEEWAGLESVVEDIKMSGAEISNATIEAFAEAVETAKAVGVQIPEGLAESILTSEAPGEAVDLAINSIISATTAKGDAMLEIAKKVGLSVPDSITSGLEEGGPSAVEAYKNLMQLFNAPEVKQKAQEYAENTGKDAGKATAKGAKDESGEMENAAKENINAFVTEAKNNISNATSAGAEIGRAGAGGAISTTALWSDAGLNVARGFAGGIRAGKNEAVNAAVEISRASYNAAHNYNEIGSPSKLYRREIGYMIGKGFALGLTDALSLVKSASNILSDTAFDDAYSATKSIEKAFAKMKETMQNGAEKGNFADSYKKAMETASSSIKNAVNGAKDSMKKASDKYFTALADANASKIEALEKQQKALREKRGDGNYKETEEEKAIAKEIETLKTRKSKIDKLKSEFASSVVSAYGSALENKADSIQKFLENRLDKITSSYQEKMDSVKSKIATMQSGLLNIGDTFNGTMTGRTLIDNVKQQISSMRDYENQLKELQSRGISKTLLKEIETMDVTQASEYMGALLTMSDAELEKYNKLFVKRAKEAKRIASEHYSEEVEAIKTGYIDEITYLFERVETAISKMGAQTMKGFINGMKETDYSREIRKMAKTIIKSMAEELQIHSPSKSAWNLGMMFSLGFTKAIEAGTKQVERAMEQYADAGTESMKKELLTSINPPEIERIKAINGVSSSGTIANAQNNGIAEAEYNITLITTLDGREIARGTAVYTQSELSRLQTIQARKEGYI